MEQYIAHIRPEGERWIPHDLDEHLREVGKRAETYASFFGSGDWARVAGLWHDLGKYSEAFQQRIRSVSGYDAHLEGKVGRVDHSTAGAQHAIKQFGVHGRILAYLIAGHHAGLPDWHSGETGGAALKARLADPSHLQRIADKPVPDEIFLQPPKPTSTLLGGAEGFALWVRMLFSCLVDADFLDTEAFMDPDKAAQRREILTIKEMVSRFNAYMQKNFGEVEQHSVNRVRAHVLQQCRDKASEAPGIFSLTVPTGGGKTLSSLAFALEHAERHGKRRVIYAIPYTSIIDQTANTFRDIFPDAVVEHHSNLDPDKETVESRLATENWDAPLIVTTNVQFFESLFAARTSRCRKLHNIVNSVVVLDETQLLPPAFLKPIVKVIKLLVEYYGVTFVLSTATQPALDVHGLGRVPEIVDDPDKLTRDLERVDVTLPQTFDQPQSWDNLARQIEEDSAEDSVLVVVNSRADARNLHSRMPEGTIHLSALMCGEHRSHVITDIKRMLDVGKLVRVVSTQLVEAGVDLDFPVVYRALAGLDSIAQAAGRCNREGKRERGGKLEHGRVIVFVPPKPAPHGPLRRAKDVTVTILKGMDGKLFTRDRFRDYFERFYANDPFCGDQHHIEELLKPDGDNGDPLKVQFRTAASRFQLIDESRYRSVIVRYDGSAPLIDELREKGPDRQLKRKLQRYTVSLPEAQFQELKRSGDVSEVWSDFFVQTADGQYDSKLGLLVDETPFDPRSLVS